jgi:hypothetical protein
MKTLAIMVALAFVVASCGVKSELVRPDGQPTAKNQKDPSNPPYPIGR